MMKPQRTATRVPISLLSVIAACSFLSAGADRAGAQPCEAGDWIPLQPAVSPPVAVSGSMVYDSSRQVIVANMASGTWEWDGQNWALRATAGPLGLMAFDTSRLYSLLLTYSGETWTWDGAQWTRIGLGGPQGGDSMAFDSDRGVAVLYAAGFATWEWDGADWALRLVMTDPELYFPQAGTEMCYDPVIHRTILQGGDWYGAETIGVTYAWDGVEWAFENSSPRRFDAGLAFDSHRGRRVLYGGAYRVSHSEYIDFGDTYEGSAEMPWRLVDDTGPGSRYSAMMAYDVARNEMVLFGGATNLPPYSVDSFTWVRRPVIIEGGPTVVANPQDVQVPLHAEARFMVDATGERLRYQWRKDGFWMHDSPGVTGSMTSLLIISDAGVEDEGAYDVIVSNPCGSVTSGAATLMLANPCPADFNDDWVLNSQDFFDYLTAFFLSRPEADFDGSGTVTSTDFFAYLTAFMNGCSR